MYRRPFTGPAGSERDRHPSNRHIPARFARYAGPAESFGQPSAAATQHLPIMDTEMVKKCDLDLSSFQGKCPSRDPDLFADAPWFDPQLLKDEQECRRFAPNDILPGRLPITIIKRHEWRMYGAIDFRWLHIRGCERKRSKREIQRMIYLEKYLPLVFKHFQIDQDRRIIPANQMVDRVYYRRRDDHLYCARLEDWTKMNDGFSTTRDCGEDTSSVDQRHLFLAPLLPAEFRFVRRTKARPSFGQRGHPRNREVRTTDYHLAKDERRWRKIYGYLVSHERKDIKLIEREYLSQMYTSAPPDWGELELPEGFFAMLPPILAYQTRHLTQVNNSPFWAVFYSEWAASVAAAWIWEIYSECRLWHLTPTLFRMIHQLGGKLSIPLGGRANYEELVDWLSILKIIDWNNPKEVPPYWCVRDNEEFCRRHSDVQDIFKGRRHPSCGDYILIHPWTKRRLVLDEVQRFQVVRANLPLDHPQGYIILDDLWKPQSEPDIIEVHPVFRPNAAPARVVSESEVPTPTKWEIVKSFLQEVGLTSADMGINLEDAVRNVRDLIYLALKKPESEQHRAVLHDFFSDFGIPGDCRLPGKNPRQLLTDYISNRISSAVSTQEKKEADGTPSKGKKRGNTSDSGEVEPKKLKKAHGSSASIDLGYIRGIKDITPRRPGLAMKVPRISIARRLMVSTIVRPEDAWETMLELLKRK